MHALPSATALQAQANLRLTRTYRTSNSRRALMTGYCGAAKCVQLGTTRQPAAGPQNSISTGTQGTNSDPSPQLRVSATPRHADLAQRARRSCMTLHRGAI